MLRTAGESDSVPEQFVGTIDAWELRHFRWPFMRTFCRAYVEQRELQYFEKQLLTAQHWQRVKCVPHRNEAGVDSTHVFDVYAVPS